VKFIAKVYDDFTEHDPSHVILSSTHWNDWFKWETLFIAYYVDGEKTVHKIGEVKIAEFNMNSGTTVLPEGPFDKLPDTFFSLGQDDSYYDNLNILGPSVRDEILAGLRDIAKDLDLFDRVLNETVTQRSLLRYVSDVTVRGQFNRICQGGARLSRYEFSYHQRDPSGNFFEFAFLIEPQSYPPTNVHVMIGRNGVGKTHLLNSMIQTLISSGKYTQSYETGGYFSYRPDQPVESVFANLVSVSFSAFDALIPISAERAESLFIKYVYVGLRKDVSGNILPKTADELTDEFVSSASASRIGARRSRWVTAVEMLETDPIFKSVEVTGLLEIKGDEEFKKNAFALFRSLSSGHKIVLLTITRLVETVEERSLVLLDEPEVHLHPPLLSAFVRALSNLLINRNGVAIVATHSPVVLQEVPSSCVYKLRKAGPASQGERLEIEPFGENVGTLTHEVFGLEVTHSGFHKLLQDAVDNLDSYEAVLSHFGGALGSEARAIVRSLIHQKNL
jgi:hypothetical protein